MRNFKKWIALILAVLMLLSLAACGGSEGSREYGSDNKDKPKSTKPQGNVETTAPVASTEPASNLTVYENTFFTVGYDAEAGWTIDEDDANVYESGGYADICIMGKDGYAEITVSIEADEEAAEYFREDMYYYNMDMKAYAAGQLETVNIGGQAMLYVDRGDGNRYFFGRNEKAGVTYNIDADNWEDPRVVALVEGITCTASATDNIDPPWPWEGTPFTGGSKSVTVGDYTITADFIPMAEPFLTFETFNHEIEVLGDKVYLLSDGLLYEYAFDGAALTFSKEIPLEEDYEIVDSSNGALVLSGFMSTMIGHDGTNPLYACEGPDLFTVAPDGTWGINWFSSGDSTEKYVFQEGSFASSPMPFKEVKTISSLSIDNNYIYVAGSPVDGEGHFVFVYDHNGTLQLQLGGDPDSSFGLGSVTYVTQTANGFLALDGNMRDVVLWAADGTWLGTAEDGDLFGTSYPWFATADVMEDGSVLVAMSEDRADESATEVIVFKISVS